MKKLFHILVCIAVLIYSPFLFGAEVNIASGIPEFSMPEISVFVAKPTANCRDVNSSTQLLIIYAKSTISQNLKANTRIWAGNNVNVKK